MRISVSVKTNSRENTVVRISDHEFKVRVNAPAREGKANQAVIETLAEYFKIAKSRVAIARGLTSKNKVVDII